MNMKVLIEVLLYVWQLPQNLLGLLLFWWYGCGCKSSKGNYVTFWIINTSVKIYRTKKLDNGSRVTGSAI